jgi:signal peptidase I
VVVVVAPGDSHLRYVKRVVGLPGEEVRILDGALLVDGARLIEPYLGGLPSSVGLGDSVWGLGPEEYFVLGDNRLRSTDSREYGPVGARLIVGKAWFRYWPLRGWGVIG